MDPYSGESRLRLNREYQAIDDRINYYPMKGKKHYSSVEYPTLYSPPEQPMTVELPTKERQKELEQLDAEDKAELGQPTRRKKTEPVQDPVPRVKGIGCTPQEYRRSTRIAEKNRPKGENT